MLVEQQFKKAAFAKVWTYLIKSPKMFNDSGKAILSREVHSLSASACARHQHKLQEHDYVSLNSTLLKRVAFSSFADEILAEGSAFGALDGESETTLRPVDVFLMGLGYYDNSAEYSLDEISANAYTALSALEESTNRTPQSTQIRQEEEATKERDAYPTVSTEGKQKFCKRSNNRSSKPWRMRLPDLAVKNVLPGEASESSTHGKSDGKNGSHGSLAANSQLNLIPQGEVQKRTLKTTTTQGCVEPVASPSECQSESLVASERNSLVNEKVIKRDDVLKPEVSDRRVKVASAEVLRSLTVRKDMERLRKTLSEERWPSLRRLKTFISDLFDVIIEKSEDANEMRRFVEDFASTNNRAYLSNTVSLTLLTRIVREESLQAAIAYAGQMRNLFLTKPPLHFDQHLNQVAMKLFDAILEKNLNDTIDIQHFCDTLIDLNYIPDSTAYLLAAMRIQLQKNSYHAAYGMWKQNVRKCRTMAGSHLLIQAILLETTGNNEKERKLRSILDEHEKCGDIFSGLAEIVVELLKADKIADAKMMMKRIKILGQHFTASLLRLKEDKSNLPFIELFAGLLAESLLMRSKKNNTSPSLEISPYIKSILESWQPQRKKYQKKTTKKKFKTDARQLQKLVHTVQYVWFELAANSGNKESLSRLFAWSHQNNCEVSSNLRLKYEKILVDDGEDL